MSKTVIYISNVLSLKDEKLFDKYYNLMPKYRKAKIDRYVFMEDKILSLGVGVLLKKACNDCNINSDMEVYFNQFEKPYFKNSNVFFSLSHSNEMAMCSISERDIGCDIEYMKKITENVASKVFTDKEIEEFNTNSIDGFYSLWTLKESYLKKLGNGFSFSPKKIEFEKNLRTDFDKETSFYLDEIDGYKFACAYETDNIEIKKINLENITF